MSTLDELAIRDLNARYIDAVNRYHAGDWAATWSEDATWDLLGNVIEGRDAILATWQGAMGSFEFALMMLNSGTLRLDGQQGTGRWYLTEHLKPGEGDAQMVLGVYDDEYSCASGSWLFTRRSYRIIYQGPPDLSGTYTPYRPD
jgi:hypothetical protein